MAPEPQYKKSSANNGWNINLNGYPLNNNNNINNNINGCLLGFAPGPPSSEITRKTSFCVNCPFNAALAVRCRLRASGPDPISIFSGEIKRADRRRSPAIDRSGGRQSWRRLTSRSAPSICSLGSFTWQRLWSIISLPDEKQIHAESSRVTLVLSFSF